VSKAGDHRIHQGGIIAAGDGTRLRADGCRSSKPMVAVAGRPLIAHSLERFRASDIRRLSIIINEQSEDCRQWLTANAGDLELDLVVKSTPSSYASFRLIAERLAGAPAVITTVDSILPTASFRHFVEGAAALPPDAFALGLTGHVDDEKPLWANLDRVSGRIVRLGDPAGGLVTAGLYALPARRPAEPADGFARLRDYLGWLVREGHPVHGIVLDRVFDIDRARDIAAAELALRESSAP
jgi:NDP-sugar pyrophosphorylase family protein